MIQNIYVYIKPEKTVDAYMLTMNSIENVFDKYNVHEVECNIEGFYYIGTRYYGESGSVEILDRIAGKLSITSEYKYEKNRTDTGSIACLNKAGNSSDLEIKLITNKENISENVLRQKNYIAINLNIYNSIESGYYYKNLVNKTITEIKKIQNDKEEILENRESDKNVQEVSTRMVIKGCIYGKADLNQQKAFADDVIKRLEAEEIFSNADKEMYSAYAYSKTIDDYVAIGRERINVNIAFNYDEDSNCTFVYIGSPIVNYDY